MSSAETGSRRLPPKSAGVEALRGGAGRRLRPLFKGFAVVETARGTPFPVKESSAPVGKSALCRRSQRKNAIFGSV